MRCFFALPIESNINLDNFIRKVKKHFDGEKITWVQPSIMHITLNFLGEQPDELVRNIIDNLKSLSLNIPLIKLNVIRPLVFGSRYNPRVIGLLAESNNYVSELKSITDTIALNYGIEIEKREFVPHITFGRVKQVNNLKLYETYENMSYQHISLIINKFQFLKSELTPDGPIYSVLWESLFDSNTDN